MGLHDDISEELKGWIEQQPLFFVASAPLSETGHVNLSPRGHDTLRVLDRRRVLILDFTGSGNETAAHLMENGRITVMFCAFADKPKILRLYGRGEVILPESDEWSELRKLFAEDLHGVRQLFRIDVDKVKTSCGFGVPLMDYRSQRTELSEWLQKKGEEGLREYRKNKNSVSQDGLPAPGFEP